MVINGAADAGGGKMPEYKAKRGSLAIKMATLIMIGVSTVFALAFSYNYYKSRETILKSVEEIARQTTLSTVNTVEDFLNTVEKGPEMVAKVLESNNFGAAADIDMIINDMLDVNDKIYGSTISFEPFKFAKDKKLFAPYIYNLKNRRIKSDLGTESYNYLKWDWYTIPKQKFAPVWTEPYFDEGGGNIMMTTYTAPFFKKIGNTQEFYGVVTADVSLEWLLEMISSIKFQQSGFAFVISKSGKFVSYPSKDHILKKTIFELARENGIPELESIGKEMTAGKTGFTRVKNFCDKRATWFFYTLIPSAGWSMGVVYFEDELFASLKTLTEQVMLIVLMGFLLLFIVIFYISEKLIKPLSVFTVKAEEIAKGNLDVIIPMLETNDEVEALSGSFENMRVALKEYINNLALTTAAKERIESELKIAHSIQMSFLPKHFPPLVNPHFELSASLVPAKEVGGDLYDYFMIDTHRLFIMIGDVSGKGVPAALFMAVTKTLMKGIGKQNPNPANMLKKVNHELSIDNDLAMFVTVFCAIFDTKTGKLVYSNAGHNPPVLVKQGRKAEWLPIPIGSALGINDHAQFENSEIHLAHGDLLLTYTDGVTEAMNESKELYGDDKLLELGDGFSGIKPDDVVMKIFDEINLFSGNEPQSDDITMLALKIR